MKKIVIEDDILNFQDFEGNLEEGEEIEVMVDGKKQVKKVKKTELFGDAQIIRLFKHSGNSYEFGPAKDRHKIHYFSESDGKKKLVAALRIAKMKEDIVTEVLKLEDLKDET